MYITKTMAQRRSKIFHMLNKYMNDNNRGSGGPKLFDCGSLGFVVVRWDGLGWNVEWFSEASELPGGPV